MKLNWIVIATAGLAVIAADPALARAKKHVARQCLDRPARAYTAGDLFFGRPAPQPNGCAPPVFNNGQFVGQDPDSNIRAQLRRDPATGYSAQQN